MIADVTAYDDRTLARVAAGLRNAGMSDRSATTCISAMQNEGILFRERTDETADVSDGYHTFGELYDHRRALTAALAAERADISWRSKAHHPDDSAIFEGGWFILGINLPTGAITYHYKLDHWDDFAEVPELEHAPKWDGASPADTVTRLLAWATGA